MILHSVIIVHPCNSKGFLLPGRSGALLFMKNFRFLLVILALLLLNACMSLDMQAIQQDRAGRPQPDSLTASLTPQLDSSRVTTDIARSRDQELQSYLRMLQSSPDHIGANLAAYDLLSDRAVDLANLEDVDELRRIYQRLPGSRAQAIPSPLLVESLVHLRRNGSGLYSEQFAGLSLSAIRENRNSARAYMQLGSVYVEKDRLEFAAALLEHARKLAPEHPAIVLELARIYGRRFSDERCDADPDLVELAMRANKKALDTRPDDPELAANLANVYRALNQPRLALLYAQKRLAVDNSAQSHADLVDMYLAAGRFDDAEQHLQQLLAVDGEQVATLEQLGRLHFIRADWSKTFDAYTRARRQQPSASLYHTLRYAISASLLGKANYSRMLIDEFQPPPGASEFERRLAEHFRQPNELTGLLAATDNRCERSSANYFLGMHAIMQNDSSKAAELFNQVVSLQDYGSDSFVGARQILNQLKP